MIYSPYSAVAALGGADTAFTVAGTSEGSRPAPINNDNKMVGLNGGLSPSAGDDWRRKAITARVSSSLSKRGPTKAAIAVPRPSSFTPVRIRRNNSPSDISAMSPAGVMFGG